MYTALTVLIIIVCVLLVLVVLVQNPKGGGLSSGFTGAGQVMGVKKTSEFIEKLTWGLISALVILCLAASFSLPTKEERGAGTSLQDELENAPANTQKQPSQQPVQPGQNPAPAPAPAPGK
jgi:preprotein translocase subunit SecG